MNRVNPINDPNNWKPVYNDDRQITGYEYTDENDIKTTISPYEFNNITNQDIQTKLERYNKRIKRDNTIKNIDNTIRSGGSRKRSRKRSKKHKRVRHTRRKQTRRHRHSRRR